MIYSGELYSKQGITLSDFPADWQLFQNTMDIHSKLKKNIEIFVVQDNTIMFILKERITH